MESIKFVAIAFSISFLIIIFITSDRLRRETFEVLNHKIGKSGKIKVINVFIILISIIIILICEQRIYNLTILNKIIKKREEAQKTIVVQDVEEVEENHEEE